jgi:glycosyltransferase involved in cell wall biosynthesis
MLNSAWMIAAWSLLAFNPFLRPSHLVIGTDPVLSILVALPWKIIRPKVRIAHWCFDLYPEAAIAEQLIPEHGLFAKTLIRLMAAAYRQCDLLADLGPCMKARLSEYYGAPGISTTIPVWAIAAPASPVVVDQSERRSLFGDTKLALLYSGSLGKAHCYEQVFDIAERFSPEDAQFVFSVRGNRSTELSHAIMTAPSNVKMADFATLDALEMRLSAADVHIVTLRPEWTGTVVPSKFVGSLAIGRPVLFIGSASSSIAKWIQEYRVGWVFDIGNSSNGNHQPQIERLVREFKQLAEDPAQLQMLFHHCHAVYQRNFSKQQTLDVWHRELVFSAS